MTGAIFSRLRWIITFARDNFTQLDDELKNWIGSRFHQNSSVTRNQKILKIIRTDAGLKFVMATYPIV